MEVYFNYDSLMVSGGTEFNLSAQIRLILETQFGGDPEHDTGIRTMQNRCKFERDKTSVAEMFFSVKTQAI